MVKEPTAQQPTQPVLRAVSLLEDAVGRFLDARKTLPKLGEYESEIEALNLSYLLIRHVEAVCAMAKRDLVLFPSAQVVARAAFETSIKIQWMLKPDDIFDREARWLAHLGSELEYHERLAGLVAAAGIDDTRQNEERDSIKSFRDQIEAMLPATVTPMKSIPKVPSMLKELGIKDYYRHYVQLCQFAHGTHAGTNIYRKNLGNGKVIGEFISPESWIYTLRCCWFCLSSAGYAILQRLGGKPEAFADKATFDRMEQAFKEI